MIAQLIESLVYRPIQLVQYSLNSRAAHLSVSSTNRPTKACTCFFEIPNLMHSITSHQLLCCFYSCFRLVLYLELLGKNQREFMNDLSGNKISVVIMLHLKPHCKSLAFGSKTHKALFFSKYYENKTLYYSGGNGSFLPICLSVLDFVYL